MNRKSNSNNNSNCNSNSGSGCQEFAQNAWKKDLCSNCYKPRSDHTCTATLVETPSVPVTVAPCWCEPARGHSASYKNELNRVLGGNNNSNNINNNSNTFINNNNNKNNDIGGRLAKKCIGSNGALLWEVGHSLTDSVTAPASGKDHDDDVCDSHESSGLTNGSALLNGHCNGGSSNGSVSVHNSRQSTSSTIRVGFREGSPQVIGYGGDDYDEDDDQDQDQEYDDGDWGSDDDDQNRDDEPSDVDSDSLEGFQLSAEEKAFSQLTDQNTEFNAYNGNLLPAAATTTTTKATRLKAMIDDGGDDNDKLPPFCPPLYAMPIKAKTMQQDDGDGDYDADGNGECVAKEAPPTSAPPPPPTTLPPPAMSSHAASSSANAKEFIVSNLYSTSPASTSDTDDFLDAEDYPADDGGRQAATSVAVAVPQLDHVHQQQQQSRAGFQSVPARLPTTNQRQSVQHLFQEEPVTAAERRAAFKMLSINSTSKPSPSPSAAVDQQSSNYSRPRMAPQIPTTLPPDSKATVQVTRAAGNSHSCHYASSYVTPALPVSVQPSSKGTSLPLTNPYSSMVIAKRQPSTDKPRPPPATTKPKPKLPAKPSAAVILRNNNKSQTTKDFCQQPVSEDTKRQLINRTSVLYQEIDESVSKESAQDIDTSAECRSSNAASVDANNRRTTPKRRAPKPPSTDGAAVLDAPDSEEVPIRNNARSCSLSSLKDLPSPTTTTTSVRQSPPKMSVVGRSQTLNSRTSTTSLDTYGAKVDGGGGDQRSFKNAKLKKNRFSLKKLLKFGGSSKDEDGAVNTKTNGIGGREKLEILHPIDLMNDGQSVSSNGSHMATQDVTSTSIQESTATTPEVPESPTDKPPLPRRTQSPMDRDDQVVGNGSCGSREKPVRPPPPVKQLFRQNTNSSNPRPSESPSGTIETGSNDQRNSIYDPHMEYANLGDIRNSVTPKKPGRYTSSMTDIATDTSGERIRPSTSHTSLQNDVYPRQQQQQQRQSPANADQQMYYSSPNDEDWPTETDDDDLEVDLKAASPDAATNGRSSRSSSSFTSEVMTALDGHRRRPCQDELEASTPVAVADYEDTETVSRTSRRTMDVDWSSNKSHRNRLSLRKAKSIVHRNLEDNYGAVVSANHQTLTQILDQVSQGQQTSAGSKLKVLDDVALRWSAFNVAEESRVTIAGKMAFYSAVWQHGNLDVTLLVSLEPLNVSAALSRAPCILTPCAEFQDDQIPQDLIVADAASDSQVRQATVWVLERTRVISMSSMLEQLHLLAQNDIDNYERDSCFVLLQLINGLKHLQAQGIEDVDGSLDDILLVTKARDQGHYRILFVPSTLGEGVSRHRSNDPECLSLCQCALKAMLLLLCVPHSLSSAWDNDGTERRMDQLEFLSAKPAFRLIGDLLLQERATSLSRAKLLLEYMIWGPADEIVMEDGATNGDSAVDHVDLAYRRWLDLERATVLNNLIRTQSLWQIRLTVFEQCMLSFLVRTCAKTLRDSADQLRKAAESMTVFK